ncbi:MAG: SusC/RagA family TonB-linked outer membrane protein [Algibacter sp.]
MKIKLTNRCCLKSLQICQFEYTRKYDVTKNISAVLNVTHALKDYFSTPFILKFMMRIFIFLFCTVLFSLTPKHAESQNDKIVINADDVISVDAVFKMIKSQTEYRFIYYGDLFKGFPKVSLKKGVVRLDKLLKLSLSTGNLNVTFRKNNTILIAEKANNQQHTVTGTVTDQAGLSIPGATVLIKGTNKGVVANLDGAYTINVPNPAHVLVFSSLGFEPQEITVGIQTIIKVSLKESIDVLREVTINAGYYNTTQRETTGSIYKIDAKTIEKQPVSNPLSAMQGYIPGVNITEDSGMPGGGLSIEIRGKNFIADNNGDAFNVTQPLYIVDGVPYGSQSLGDLSGVESFNQFNGGQANISPLNLIEPSNIESIEVLKDADATAIYGSRGANGVVLITTKKGKIGKTQINVNVSMSQASVIGFADVLNTQQYLELRLEALANDGYTLETILGDISNFDNNNSDLYAWDHDRYTDWQKVLIGGTAYRNTAQLSFSGGSEQTQFLFSGGYQNETTVFPGDSKYKKASVHTNINHQSSDKRFQINVTTDYVADDNALPPNNLSRLSRQLAPNAPVLYDGNGDLNWENGTWENPLALLENKFRSQSNNLLMSAMFSYRPIAALELKANMGYTDYRMELYTTRPHTARDPDLGFTSKESFVSTSNVSSQSWIVEPQMNWKANWDKASVIVLVGATFQEKVSNLISHSGFGFATNNQILDLSAAEIVNIRSDEDSEYKYQSIFGRFNFNWDKRYIINVTGRRDGSSRFGPGKQFGDFGAIGAAWLFSEEAFLEDNALLSFGKFRTSYGITGSDQTIGDYGFFDSYTSSEGNYDGSGLQPTQLFNPNFAWEENKKFEVAMELGFFQNRLMLTTAWYRNRSSNQLVGVPLPGTTGFPTLNANFDATVENTGLEIDFRSTNIQNDHFKWTTTFNISVPKNKLIKFDGLEDSTFANQYVVGQPLSIVKTFHSLGVNRDTGLREYEDYDGDGVINGDEFVDRQWVEDIGPKFYGGLGNTLNYNNWIFDAFFQFKKHRNVNTLTATPGFIGNNINVSALDRWQQVGDQTQIGKATLNLSNDFSALGSDNYTNTFFIRLRNVSLTYRLPKEYSHGMDASIYLQGQNLLTFTKYKGIDPDSHTPNGQLPILKQFTLGLKLGF